MRILWINSGEMPVERRAQIQAFSDVMSADIRILSDQPLGQASHLEMASVDVVPELFAPGASNIQSNLVQYIAEGGYIAVLAPHSPRWLSCLSMLAAAFNAPFYSNLLTSALPACTRSICANRLMETLPPPAEPFFATVAQSQTRQTQAMWRISGVLQTPYQLAQPTLSRFETFKNDLISLDRARLVFAGGMGLGSKQNFEKLALCAKKYGAGLAASRLAVDLGWCKSDCQVGQTGRVIAPDIYVAFGISGAIQHLAGIQNARQIFAINTDKNAPIFEYANTGFIGDACKFIDRLLEV